jgi:hypothetical protein
MASGLKVALGGHVGLVLLLLEDIGTERGGNRGRKWLGGCVNI